MEASRFDLLRIALLRGTNPMTWARLSFALALVVVGLLAQRDLSRLAYAADNPIVFENQQPGSGGWQLLSTASDVPGQVKGYASATSVNKGQPITFYVSVNPAQTYSIDVYRIGWYQGLGGRLMQHIGPLNAVLQPACPTDSTTGMIECRWAAAYTLTTQTSWTSGVYLAV